MLLNRRLSAFHLSSTFMMEESRNIIEIVVWVFLALGSILVLNSTDVWGQSLEHLRLAFNLTPLSGTGAVLIVAACLLLTALHGRLRHRR